MRTPWPVRFVLLAAIWGLSFVFIKLGVESFAPLQVAFGRLFFGAVTLVTILTLRRERLPRDRPTWLKVIVGAIFINAIPFVLFSYGEQRVSSVLAGIWNATTPLLAVPVVLALLPDERLTRARFAGLIVGFLGVLTVLGVWNGIDTGAGGTDLLGTAMCIGAAASYAIGFPFARRFLSSTGHSPVVLSTAQVLASTVQVGILTVLLTAPPTTFRVDSVIGILTLGTLGTGIAYILNYSILRDAGATIATTVTYFLPIVSVVAGVVLLNETITWNEPVGAVIIVIGAVLAQGKLGEVGRRLRGTSPATVAP